MTWYATAIPPVDTEEVRNSSSSTRKKCVARVSSILLLFRFDGAELWLKWSASKNRILSLMKSVCHDDWVANWSGARLRPMTMVGILKNHFTGFCCLRKMQKFSRHHICAWGISKKTVKFRLNLWLEMKLRRFLFNFLTITYSITERTKDVWWPKRVALTSNPSRALGAKRKVQWPALPNRTWAESWPNNTKFLKVCNFSKTLPELSKSWSSAGPRKNLPDGHVSFCEFET